MHVAVLENEIEILEDQKKKSIAHMTTFNGIRGEHETMGEWVTFVASHPARSSLVHAIRTLYFSWDVMSASWFIFGNLNMKYVVEDFLQFISKGYPSSF